MNKNQEKTLGEQVLGYINELEKENKELKEEVKKRKMIADENGEHYDMMKDEYDKLEKENKELRETLNNISFSL